jgi:DNA-binding response OmpR family regulator
MNAVPRSRARTVLLVEDNQQLLTLAREMLEERGYKVLVAKDGDSALELARQHRGGIDVLVTDVVMPGLSGPRLATKLVAVQSELRVLFISGLVQEASLKDALGPRADFLPKPFTAINLIEKVEALLHPAGQN